MICFKPSIIYLVVSPLIWSQNCHFFPSGLSLPLKMTRENDRKALAVNNVLLHQDAPGSISIPSNAALAPSTTVVVPSLRELRGASIQFGVTFNRPSFTTSYPSRAQILVILEEALEIAEGAGFLPTASAHRQQHGSAFLSPQ